MHLSDGQLRASIDHEVSEQEIIHLQTCSYCQKRMAEIASRSNLTESSMSVLITGSHMPYPSVKNGRASLESLIHRKESQGMFKNLLRRSSRPVWVGLGLVAILALASAFAPVRAIANSFLGLFRVEQVTVVEVNPANLPQDIMSSKNLEAIFAEDVSVSGEGEPRRVASVEEASSFAGIPVRLPTEIEGEMKLEVKTPMQITFTINPARIQAVLDEIGQTDIKLPTGIDGAVVTVDVPALVSATYGNCDLKAETRQEGFDPDDPSTYPSINCVTLIQMASPTIDAPPGVDLQQIGQAYLELMGMDADAAAHFSQNIDWSTTLVIPLPTSSSEYIEVTVDGVRGTIIRSRGEGFSNYTLLWVSDGIVYALTGSGSVSTALAIASSIK